ncbi:MAG: TraB/GumN family protein [Pseudomonadota bacterium]
MHRRQVAISIGALAIAPALKAANAAERGPLFWLAKRGKARVFLLGFSEAKDQSWFTPTIQTAFEQSSTHWEEVAPPMSPDQINQLYLQYGFDSQRPLFDALDPPVRERAFRYMAELGIESASIEHMKPWRAYYVFAAAYGARRLGAAANEPVYPDRALLGRAAKSAKSLRYEYPSFETFVRFMSGKAQSEYIAWLFDYFDADKRGPTEKEYAWVTATGTAISASLDRMRKLPNLYGAMQRERNNWWAQWIDTLLATGETTFVAIGMLHVLGPDGIPRHLQGMGVDVQESARFA